MRFGDFCAYDNNNDNDNDNDDKTDYFTPCACAQGKNHRIQRLTPEGKYITEVGREGKGDLEFDCPVGMGIHPVNNMIYVSENKNNHIQILKQDLTFSSYIYSVHEFREPKDAAFDISGNIYVADNGNHQIQVFAANGTFLYKFGERGITEGALTYPSSISIDSTNLVYVVELYNHRVSLFTPKGYHVKSFGSQGKGPGQFDEALGI